MNNHLFEFIENGRKGNNKGFDYSIERLNKYIKIWNGRYYLIFAYSGVGKSKFAYHQHIFNVIDQQIRNNIVENLHIDLYSLEISPVTVRGIMLIFYLRKYHNIITDTNQIFSYENKIDDKLLKIINDKKTLKYMEEVEKYINIYTRLTFSTLINNTEKYLKTIGNLHKENNKIKSFDKKYNKYLYQIIIDHISLIDNINGKSKYESIGIISKYLFAIRNITGLTPVVIQQANHDNKKKLEDRLSPEHKDLRDNKETFNDSDIAIVVGSPFLHKIKNFNGYKIFPAIDAGKGLQDRFRVIELRKNRYGGGGNRGQPVLFIGETSEYIDIKDSLKLTEKDYLKINNLKKKYG